MKGFKQYIHPAFLAQVQLLASQGFQVSIVGGTCRDFILGRHNKHDYDCELRFDKDISWSDFNLVGFESYEELAYKIKRFKFTDYECEFSLPRLERFIDNELNHKNFYAEFDSQLSFKEAAKRRDFRFNAIYFKYNPEIEDFEIEDPFDGIFDIKSKLIRSCDTSSFYKDPVRILRAIRFHILLGFEFESSLFMNSLNFTHYHFSKDYLLSECQKSQNTFSFISLFYKIVRKIDLGESFTRFEDYCRGQEFDEFVKQLVFLEDDYRSMIIRDFDLRKGTIKKMDFPYRFLGHKELSSFIAEVRDASSLANLFKLNGSTVNFLNDENLIDLSPDQLEKIKVFKCDVSEVPASMRACFILFKAIEELNEN